MTGQRADKRLRRLVGLAFGLLLGGCSIATPYKDFSAKSPADGATVIVSITHAMLGDDPLLRKRFWTQVERVETALADQPGLIGFSKRVDLMGDSAWTMTVWRDEASLKAFMLSETHQTAIRNGMPGLKGARFARLEIDRRQAPLSWEEALAHLETHASGYGHAR